MAINHAKTQKGAVLLIAFSFEAASDGTPDYLIKNTLRPWRVHCYIQVVLGILTEYLVTYYSCHFYSSKVSEAFG